MTRRLIIAFFIMIMLILLAGCSRQAEQKPVSPPKAIGVSVVSKDEDLKKQLRKAMEENAKQEGFKIIWKESEPDKQEEDVKKLFESKIKALIIEFADETAAATIAREAKIKDVPVLALGLLPKNVPLDGFIGIDAYRSGLQQSQFMINAFKDESLAQILIIKGLGHSAEEAILQGNLDGFKDHPNIKTTLLEVLPEEKISVKLASLEELDKFHGLIIHDPAWMEEVISLLEDLELDDKLVTVGIGASKQSIKAILNGTHEAEIDLDPKLLGKYAYTGAKELVSEGQWQFEKQETSGSYDIPVKYVPANIITKENIFLVEKRFEDLLGQQGQEESGSSGQKGSDSSSEEEQKDSGESKGGGKQSKVIIQTKEGKTMEVEVEGEVLKVEIQGGGGESSGEKSEGSGDQQKGSEGGQ